MRRRIALASTGILLTASVTAAVTAPSAVADSPGRTEVASVGAAGNGSAGAASSPAVSADGTQVAFESRAALDPVVAPGSPYNVYVRDRRSPAHTVLISRALPTTYLASRGSAVPVRTAAGAETGGDGDSIHPSISATGRYVAFESVAGNLRDGFGRPLRRVVICDRDPDDDGVFDELGPDGVMDFGYLYLGPPPAGANVAAGSDPTLSAAGTTVAWRDQQPGATDARIAVTRVVLDPQGRPLTPDPAGFRYPELEGSPGAPRVSADGSQVAFTTGVCPALLACTAGSVQVFDLESEQTTRVDYLPDGNLSGTAEHPAISGSGRLIAYEHTPEPGVPPVTVVVDRDPAGSGRLGPGPDAPVTSSIASRDSSGQPAEGRAPTLSADGRYLAFESSATDLYGDSPGSGPTAIVLRDLTVDAARDKAGLPRLTGDLGSPAASGCAKTVCPAEGPSTSPGLSADGSVLVFTSAGDDLVSPNCCAGSAFVRIFQPRVIAAPTAFGTVPVSGTATRAIVVAHSGFGPLTITKIYVSGDAGFQTGAAENCVGATLHGSETCVVTVDFRPGSSGPKQAVLRVEQRDGTVTDVPLTGAAEAGPTVSPTGPPTAPGPGPGSGPGSGSGSQGGLVVTPEPLDFGGDQPALVPIGQRTVQIRNAATIPITVAAIAVLDGPRFIPGDFAVVRTKCTQRRLEPGGACSADVQATPQLPGQRSGVLAITATDPAYTRLIPLTAQAAQPLVVVNPAVVRANRVTTVTGQNFPPGRPITLTATTPGSHLSAKAVTGPDGRWTTPLIVFPQTGTGTWPVIATVDGTAIRAQAPVLVVPASYQPPDFTSRR
ncbi:choice-of-anchor D domain-containing protein [Kribbella sp. NPDC003557]|uniref:choice-of-anchor D domain-containing protein n=1 Tax=Kribbella sp. NPDC003557 TaxID=3154449 RepID=UPI0033BE7205